MSYSLGVMTPDYFREIHEVLASTPGGPPDMAKVAEIMRRHGLTPAPPPADAPQVSLPSLLRRDADRHQLSNTIELNQVLQETYVLEREVTVPEKMTVEEASNLDREEFVNRFGSLYESSPWVAEGAWRERPFRSLSGMHAAFVRTVRDASFERRLGLIRAHPDLAGKAAVAGELTPESAREQASAGLDRLSPEEYGSFTRLNEAYKEKFGFPMIFAVKENTKETILSGAETRLGNSRPEEMETAISEIAKIGHFRLRDLVRPEPHEAMGDPRVENP